MFKKRIAFNFWDAVIGNFDETPIVFNMISKGQTKWENRKRA